MGIFGGPFFSQLRVEVRFSCSQNAPNGILRDKFLCEQMRTVMGGERARWYFSAAAEAAPRPWPRRSQSEANPARRGPDPHRRGVKGYGKNDLGLGGGQA